MRSINYFITALVIISLLSVSFTALGSGQDSSGKIQSEVADLVASQDNVSVLILMKDKKGSIDSLDNYGALSVQENNPGQEISYVSEHSKVVQLEVKQEDLAKLEQNPDVLRVDKVDDMHILLQDSVKIINANTTWTRAFSGANLTGRGRSICVIDTGINYTHPDLGGCTNVSFLAGTCGKVLGGYDFQNSDNNPLDDNGHGTHVAGTAAANASVQGAISGVAPEATLVSIKVCDSSGSCALSNIANGIDWCVGNYSVFNISAISISLGDSRNATAYCDSADAGTVLLAGSINAAIQKNITVTISAGNDGNYTGLSSPACIQNATSVGSADKADAVSAFSNRDEILDVFATGSSINSTCLPGSSDFAGGYCRKSGTSMAAPHVAGAVALIQQSRMIQLGRVLTQPEVETRLKNFGNNFTDSGGSGLAFPRINIYRSIDSLTFPNFTWESRPNLTIANQNITFNLSATDSFLGIQSANITINSTSYNMTRSGDTYFFTYTVPNVQNLTYNITFFDTAQSNTTENVLLQVGDSTPPKFSNISSTSFNYTLPSVFNISWQDELAISNVWIEFSGVNYTGANITNSSSIYMFNISAAAGNYGVKWFANDTSNNVNMTIMLNVTISRADPIINLTFNVSGTTYNSDISVENETSVNITATSAGEGKIDLIVNGILYGRLASLISNSTNFTAGTHNVTAFYNITQNYSSSFMTFFVTSQNTDQAPIGFKIFPSSQNYTKNATVVFRANATDASLANATIFLYNITGGLMDVNHTNVTGTFGEVNWTYSLSEGNYSWNVRFSDNRSNSNFSDSTNYSFVIDTTLPGASLSISDTTSVSQDTSVNITCTGSDTHLSSVAIIVAGSQFNSSTTLSQIKYEYEITSSGDKLVTCLVKDRAGNVQTHNNTIDVEAESSGDSGGGGSGGGSSGSGGGGAAVESATANYVFPSLIAGQTVKVIPSNLAKDITGIAAVVITTKAAATNVKINLMNASATKVDTSIERTDKIYHYIQIDHENLPNSAIKEVNITFEVKTSWLKDKNISKQNVTLKRYVNGTGWEKIPTKNVTETSAIITYKAVSPGLSFFAIAGETGRILIPDAVNTTTTTSNETAVEEEKSSGKVNWIYVLIAVIIATGIGLAIAAFFLRNSGKKYIHKTKSR